MTISDGSVNDGQISEDRVVVSEADHVKKWFFSLVSDSLQTEVFKLIIDFIFFLFDLV